jgi:hypothetical protein
MGFNSGFKVLKSYMPKQLSASQGGICYLSPERFLQYCESVKRNDSHIFETEQNTVSHSTRNGRQGVEQGKQCTFTPLHAELNPICHLLALLGAHPILHVSRIRVKVTLTGVRITTAAMDINKYYICSVCVCSLNYPACKEHALYKHFPTLSHKRQDFRKTVTEHKMCVLIFYTTF